MSYLESDGEKGKVREVRVRRALTSPRSLNGDGIQPCLEMLQNGLLNGHLRQNALTGRAEIDRSWDKARGTAPDWHTMNDTDLSNIRCHMSQMMVDYRSDLDDALRIYLGEHEYDPVTDLLDSLEWDRKPRLETFLSHCLAA